MHAESNWNVLHTSGQATGDMRSCWIFFTIFKHLQTPNWSERTRFFGQRYRYPQRWWNTGMTALQILTAQNMKGVDHCYDSTLSGGDYSEGPQLIGIGLRLHMVYLPDWSQIGYWNRGYIMLNVCTFTCIFIFKYKYIYIDICEYVKCNIS